MAVEAEGNPQLKIYALGAIAANCGLVTEETVVRMAIYQPRRHSLSEAEMEAGALIGWGEDELRPKAMEAYAGGEQAAGDWCRFCKVKGQCAECMRRTMEIDFAADPELMRPEDYAAVLPKLEMAKAWCEAAGRQALEMAMRGMRIEGYKVVRGRGKRVVADALALAARLRDEGFDDADIYKDQEPQLCGITELERLVGRKRLERVAEGLILKQEGSPALAPESDKRKAIETDFDVAARDFEGM